MDEAASVGMVAGGAGAEVQVQGKGVEITEVMVARAVGAEEVQVSVLVGEINPRDASFILTRLSYELPLQRFSLTHLKRVRRRDGKLQVLLCPESEQSQYPQALQGTLSTEVIGVCRYAPLTRSEFEAWGQWWPTLFRPNDVDRDREKGTHSADEAQEVASYFAILDSGRGDGGCGSGLMVNPVKKKVVVTCGEVFAAAAAEGTADVLQRHPLMTPSLVCIEGVARITRGQARDVRDAQTVDPYLCTGLDLYLLREPCLMSAMALVHSRIRRVYFLHADESNGALQSHYHLHTLRALNHRFRVFRVSLAT